MTTIRDLLKMIFKDPAPTIIIHGKKGSGKTDLSLSLAEKCLEYGYVKQVATNIKTDRFTHIDSLAKLKKWLRSTTKSKLFILDEAGVYVHARRSMSKANVNFLRLAHLIRKFRCKWILITVRFKDLDTGLRDPEICTAIFQKLDKKVAKVYLTVNDEIYLLTDIPKTKVKYDTYQIAEFNFEEEEEEIPEELLEDPDIRACYLYAKTGNFHVVRKAIDVCSHNTVRKHVRRGILKLIYLALVTGQKGGLTSNNVLIQDIKNVLQEVDVVG